MMALHLANLEGKYEILSKLREGGMGAIYRVRHRLLHEVRVVKVLKPHHEDDEELRERFAREARAAIQLRHPNVVQIYDFSLDESGVGLIVMEYIAGNDLARLVEAKRLPSLPLALEIARQSLRSLGFLHRLGFVHRDVSPDNLMITQDVEGRPLVKLIDLGIAKSHGAEQSLTVSGSFLGKFRYASPEHFGAQGPDGTEARSDLYTFGLVFYELLTGRYPMPGDSTSQLIASHLFQAPVPFENTDPDDRIPEAVRRMVMKSLEKKVDDRYADAAEWIADIKALQGEYPLDAAAYEEAIELTKVVDEEEIRHTGSTQIQFDRIFAPEKTPRPSGPLIERTAKGADPLGVLLTGAEALFELGRSEQARQQVRTILGMDPKHAGAQDLQARLDARDSSPVVEKTVALPKAEAEPLSGAPLPAGAFDEIESYLHEGSLVKADRRLRELEEEHGRSLELSRLRDRLEEHFQGQLRVKIQELLEEAHGLVNEGEYPGALERVRQAQELAPDSGELHEELTQGVQRLQREIETRERRRAVEQIEQQVLLLLRERRLTQARLELDRAEENLGAHEVFESLGKILERALQERQSELVAQAGQALEEGRFDTAIELLQDVLELDPGNSWVKKQLEKVRADKAKEKAAQEETQRLEDERRADIEATRELMSEGDLDIAEAQVQVLEAKWGAPTAADLWEELAVARRRRTRDLLGEAEQAREAADLLKARLLVAEANNLSPDDTAVGEFAKLLDAKVKDHVEGEPIPLDAGSGLLHTIAEIERLRVEGQPLQAWKALQQAIAHFGESDTLVNLRQELAEQILEDS